MLSAPQKRKNINLISKEGFEYSQTGKILAWLLTVGRAIVICTEIVVIGAFLSRFWLDKTLTDLYEQNNSKRAQIEASSAFVSEFNTLQTRINITKSVGSNKSIGTAVVKKITSLLPPGVIITNFSFSEKEVTLKGNSLSEGGLVGFTKALESQKEFQNPTLTNISMETIGQQLISFTIKFGNRKGV